ncbi:MULTISPECIES: hypothetical protein [unclassified Streptomyces]|uniref:hypothetical protein n=1 Tax=unclassified Streptomyces TaxID=2593676 RepID=UPI002DD7F876|nr:hypothetical protein [Streptomyces sp. NBC_01750]WSB00828.1 hypothetical protein OIE54_16845 [Streptomyces sp. NBC_01794]WSD34817.1 hypothetical protein OG966_24755 [Streptomyces sp. NBC_01750]
MAPVTGNSRPAVRAFIPTEAWHSYSDAAAYEGERCRAPRPVQAAEPNRGSCPPPAPGLLSVPTPEWSDGTWKPGDPVVVVPGG